MPILKNPKHEEMWQRQRAAAADLGIELPFDPAVFLSAHGDWTDFCTARLIAESRKHQQETHDALFGPRIYARPL